MALQSTRQGSRYSNNLHQDQDAPHETSGDKFHIELDRQALNGVAGGLMMRRAGKLKVPFGEDIRVGRFAGFGLFRRPGLNDTTQLVHGERTR
jgi:hypothetical protein